MNYLYTLEDGRLHRYKILEEDKEDSLYWIQSSPTSAMWVLQSDSRYMKETPELKHRFAQENPDKVYAEILEGLGKVKNLEMVQAIIQLVSSTARLSEAELTWAKRKAPGLILYPFEFFLSQLCDSLGIGFTLTIYGWDCIFTIEGFTFTSVAHKTVDEARLAGVRLFKLLTGEDE